MMIIVMLLNDGVLSSTRIFVLINYRDDFRKQVHI